MAKMQNRRTVSIKGPTYARIALALQGMPRVRDKAQDGTRRIIGSIADFIEDCVRERLDEMDVPHVTLERAKAERAAKRGAREEHERSTEHPDIRQHFTF